VMRIRLAVVTGWRRVDGSSTVPPPWEGALMGWPPQPTVWQSWDGKSALIFRDEEGWHVRPFCRMEQSHN